jgi:hypothetical protein
MRKVMVNEFMSLDGVVQASGAADEDTSTRFQYGGWHLRSSKCVRVRTMSLCAQPGLTFRH